MNTKRGSLSDLSFLLIGFFFVFLFLLFFSFIGNFIFDALIATPMMGSGTAQNTIVQYGYGFVENADQIAIAFFFGALFGFIISSWFVAGNPLGMVAYFFGGLIVILISMGMSNFWSIVYSNPLFSDITPTFGFTNFVMSHLPYFMAIFFIVGLVITFVKPADLGQQGGTYTMRRGFF